MTTKHTPGPWTISGANTIHGQDCIVAFVGTADEEVRRLSGERQNADARLIAAAPDLLEALEEITEAFDLRTARDQSSAYDLKLVRARATIRKARGAKPSMSLAIAERRDPVNSRTDIRRFTVYRRGDLSETHNANQVNPADQPQYEGVVFSDGTTVVRWLTAARSTSVWADFETMWKVHGHDDPTSKHGTVIVWHDGDEKETP